MIKYMWANTIFEGSFIRDVSLLDIVLGKEDLLFCTWMCIIRYNIKDDKQTCGIKLSGYGI